MKYLVIKLDWNFIGSFSCRYGILSRRQLSTKEASRGVDYETRAQIEFCSCFPINERSRFRKPQSLIRGSVWDHRGPAPHLSRDFF
ncbi:hypothetical protein L484_028054 [Morus notabilis]|uniref:Uncharacterized protein n=1 Tax=Morus notabilis TaxID=981085 RepID=W9S7U4_9ROSA|nr:hypothetical protein L484_028054 [Morus notabilis]